MIKDFFQNHKKAKIIGLVILLGMVINFILPNHSEERDSTENSRVTQLRAYKNKQKVEKAKIIEIQDDIDQLKQENSEKDEELSQLQKSTDNTEIGANVNPENTAIKLAEQRYAGSNEIVVNHNTPSFTSSDLNTSKGAWESYGNLDSLNRATKANALLNKSIMPTAKRTSLTWNPTGWHNKKISSGWLYNRSHLIGFQLSGENNNPKNLITGTRQLNSPEMLAHEMDVAYYLKQSSKHYVRYRVTPIFRANELLARGVQMEAQSVGDNVISFNVYIFNVQDGVTLNYNDGTSQVN